MTLHSINNDEEENLQLGNEKYNITATSHNNKIDKANEILKKKEVG